LSDEATAMAAIVAPTAIRVPVDTPARALEPKKPPDEALADAAVPVCAGAALPLFEAAEAALSCASTWVDSRLRRALAAMTFFMISFMAI